MDAKVVYWTGAWINFSLLLAFVVVGVRGVKRGDVALHRRSMIAASALVVLFLLSYWVKLEVLGREDMSVWDPLDVTILRIHESCVLVMLLAGGIALVLGRLMRRTRNVTHEREDPPASPGRARSHRVAGRVAAVAAGLGWLTAAFVLWGMIARANETLSEARQVGGSAVAALRDR